MPCYSIFQTIIISLFCQSVFEILNAFLVCHRLFLCPLFYSSLWKTGKISNIFLSRQFLFIQYYKANKNE